MPLHEELERSFGEFVQSQRDQFQEHHPELHVDYLPPATDCCHLLAGGRRGPNDEDLDPHDVLPTVAVRLRTPEDDSAQSSPVRRLVTRLSSAGTGTPLAISQTATAASARVEDDDGDETGSTPPPPPPRSPHHQQHHHHHHQQHEVKAKDATQVCVVFGCLSVFR